MKRTDLLAALKKAAPALSGKELVPSYSHFLFDGETVRAFDGVVAIETPCDLDLTGGLPGSLLINWLAGSRARDVALLVDDDGVALMRAARGRLKLPVLGEGDFVFEWPEADDKRAVKMTDNLHDALKAAAVSIGVDPTAQWRMGITCDLSKRGVVLLSSDDFTLTRCEVKAKLPKVLHDLTAILPPRWCELVLSLGRPKLVLFADDWVEAQYDDGTRVFSRTLEGAEPDLFDDVLGGVQWDEQFHDIPQGLDGCISRALVVLGGADEQLSDIYAKKDGKLRFHTKGNVGEARDWVKMPDQEPVRVRARPLLLRRAIPHADSMLVMDGAVVFKGSRYQHMVGVVSE